ncbi:hypothetical protein ACLOJK_030840 [Asimina triloba]
MVLLWLSTKFNLWQKGAVVVVFHLCLPACSLFDFVLYIGFSWATACALRIRTCKVICFENESHSRSGTCTPIWVCGPMLYQNLWYTSTDFNSMGMDIGVLILGGSGIRRVEMAVLVSWRDVKWITRAIFTAGSLQVHRGNSSLLTSHCPRTVGPLHERPGFPGGKLQNLLVGPLRIWAIAGERKPLKYHSGLWFLARRDRRGLTEFGGDLSKMGAIAKAGVPALAGSDSLSFHIISISRACITNVWVAQSAASSSSSPADQISHRSKPRRLSRAAAEDVNPGAAVGAGEDEDSLSSSCLQFIHRKPRYEGGPKSKCMPSHPQTSSPARFENALVTRTGAEDLFPCRVKTCSTLMMYVKQLSFLRFRDESEIWAHRNQKRATLYFVFGCAAYSLRLWKGNGVNFLKSPELFFWQGTPTSDVSSLPDQHPPCHSGAPASVHPQKTRFYTAPPKPQLTNAERLKGISVIQKIPAIKQSVTISPAGPSNHAMRLSDPHCPFRGDFDAWAVEWFGRFGLRGRSVLGGRLEIWALFRRCRGLPCCCGGSTTSGRACCRAVQQRTIGTNPNNSPARSDSPSVLLYLCLSIQWRSAPTVFPLSGVASRNYRPPTAVPLFGADAVLSGGDLIPDSLESVRTALGVLQAATALYSNSNFQICIEYLEAVPWEDKEEEAILKDASGLGPSAMSILARIQPVDSTAYMLMEDEDLPLIITDDDVKADIERWKMKIYH